MILQKSFLYSDLLLKKHFLSLLMLKTDFLLNIFVETMKLFSTFFDKQKQDAQMSCLKWTGKTVLVKPFHVFYAQMFFC